jgi:G:T-mismatch repair DNA endonuclease (very short patch repair protein)
MREPDAVLVVAVASVNIHGCAWHQLKSDKVRRPQDLQRELSDQRMSLRKISACQDGLVR